MRTEDNGVQPIEAATTSAPPVKPATTKKPATKKPAAEPNKPVGKSPDVVTLASLCKELKIDSVAARVILRAAVEDKKLKHKPKSAWQWEKRDPVLKTVRALLGGK